jgi:fatty acid desaturase
MYVIAACVYGVDLAAARSLFQNPDQDIHIAKPDTAAEQGLLIWSSILYFGATVGFFVYGYVIYVAKHREQQGIRRTRAQRLVLRKIFWPAAYIMVAFLIRAGILVLQLKVKIAGLWYVVLLFYVFLEVLPLCLMMFVFTARDLSQDVERHGSMGSQRDSQTLYSSYEPLLYS